MHLLTGEVSSERGVVVSDGHFGHPGTLVLLTMENDKTPGEKHR